VCKGLERRLAQAVIQCAMVRTPTLFLSHGSPMTALDPREAGTFLQALGPALEAGFGRPKAIVVASAHTLTRVPAVMAAARHEAVYDFGGFDPRLRTLRYDAPGSPALAVRVDGLLQAAGLPVQRLAESGLDHGIWTPLRYLFPRADIPVVPLGWPPGWSATQLFGLGQALAPLADEGVLVLGSGSLTHNLQRVFAGQGMVPVDAPATPESTAFRDWWAARAAAADWPALLDWRQQAPHATLMHPSDEHLLPFFIAAGASTPAGTPPGPAARVHASLTHGDLAMDAYAFGAWGLAHPWGPPAATG
jgi:4,5-DOPA dioxygenase extradiol